MCDTGRYRMPYFCWGAGPPLVFVHGAGDVSRSFVMVMSRLSAHFRCVGYDLPSGHGDGAVLRRYTHDDLVGDLWALLDRLGLDRAYLLGSSFGSTITLQAMRQRPNRVPRAVLQGGLARRRLRVLERLFGWAFRRCPGPTGKLPRRTRMLELVHQPAFARQSPEVWQAYVEWTGEARLAALGYQAKWLHGLDLRSNLPQVRQPVLLVVGDRDSVVPRPYAEVLLGGLPNAGMAVIEGAGHVPYYSHPEAMAEVVRRFLTPPGQGCGGREACEHHPTSSSA
ncbi:MAG: alpha/beta hydrolase [Gemmataceae bacterium]